MDAKHRQAFAAAAEEVSTAIRSSTSPRFLTCLFAALIAALPGFLEAFMQCLAQGGQSEHNPGDRNRC